LLGSCDRRHAPGRRDYAIVIILLRLGLRRSEVAGLTLDDIDWRGGRLLVRGKGSRQDALPLRAGLERVGAHRLRHTAATGMLRAGASLPEVAQVLRHERLETTAQYARVDRRALRELARPWPGSAA
jgi:integrase/recombinase XerD